MEQTHSYRYILGIEVQQKPLIDSKKGQYREKKRSQHRKNKASSSDGNILENSPRLKQNPPTILSGFEITKRGNQTHGQTSSEKS